MLFDTHIHTSYSDDSDMLVETAVGKANDLGLGVTFTEHIDLAYPEPHTITFDVGQYFRDYTRYRGNKVLLGIEVGMGPGCVEDNRIIIDNHPFDYVLGSIHAVGNVDIYREEYYRLQSKREAYIQYFEAMLTCLKAYDFIDSLGHIDYIARYARYEDTEVYYHEFSDWIDAVLNFLVQNNKAMEINTRRLTSQAAVDILRPIYRRFYELGGRMVTIGSDAHRPHDIGKRLSVGYDLAADCNLKAVYFKQRKPEIGR